MNCLSTHHAEEQYLQLISKFLLKQREDMFQDTFGLVQIRGEDRNNIEFSLNRGLIISAKEKF